MTKEFPFKNIYLKILLIQTCLLFPSMAIGAEINGTVTDACSGSGVSYAVVAANKVYEDDTDKFGNYAITVPRAGTYMVVASKAEYSSQNKNVTIPSFNPEVTVNFSLGPDSQKPIAITEPATSISLNTATLVGEVNHNGHATSYYFDYGTTANYGSTTSLKHAYWDTTYYENITGLMPGTTYHFRVVAENCGGTSHGEDRTFETPPMPALEAVYPTLGKIGQGLNVELIGNGFDANTRVSMYPDLLNRGRLVGSEEAYYAKDVAVSGNYAYVAAGNDGFKIVDISDPTNPKTIAPKEGYEIDIENYAVSVEISGNYAYVMDLDYYGYLYVIDVTNPSEPQILGTTPFHAIQGECQDIAVDGDYIYVASQYNLYVIDVATPSNPFIIGDVPASLPGQDAEAVAVEGNYAYVVDNSGFHIFDVSNKSIIPQHRSSVTAGISMANGVAVSGDFAYVTDNFLEFDGIHVINISSLWYPHITGTIETEFTGFNLTVSGDKVFVGGGLHGVTVLDISDPSTPQEISLIDTPDFAHSVAVSGDYAYVADGLKGLQAINIKDLETSKTCNWIDPADKFYSKHVHVSGDYAYLTGNSSWLNPVIDRFHVVDVNPSSATYLEVVGSLPSSGAVTTSGNYAYVAEGNGLTRINISTPENPSVVNSIPTPGQSHDVAIKGEYAYVADGDGDLQIINIGNPDLLFFESSVPVPGYAKAVAVSGNHAYVASGINGFHVIENIGTPSSAGHVGSVSIVAEDVVVSGDYAYVVDGVSGFHVIDHSTKTNPNVVASLDMPGYPRSVTVEGDKAYVAVNAFGLVVIDTSTPTSPMVVCSVRMPGGYARSVAIDGERAYVASGDKGLCVMPLPREIIPDNVTSQTSICATLPSPAFEGHYTLRVFNNDGYDSDLPGAVSFFENVPNAKAIIIAGGGPDASLWNETKKCANKAYDVLVYQGFKDSEIVQQCHSDVNLIYYLTHENTPNRDGIPTSANLQNAISTWASDATHLLLYIVDHGEPDHFIVHEDSEGNREKLNVRDLDQWLDHFQDGTGKSVMVMYDACKAGTFLTKMRPPAGSERVIITGSSNEDAFFYGQGEDSFSYQFWDLIRIKEGSVGEAFREAAMGVKGYQTACANSDGDLQYNEPEDISPLWEMVIQRGVPTHSLVTAPIIMSVGSAQILTGGDESATISVSDVFNAESVWAQIIPPDYDSLSSNPDFLPPPVPLTGPDTGGIYQGIYSQFTSKGTYPIIIKALRTQEVFSYITRQKETINIYSEPVTTSVTQTVGSGHPVVDPDEFEDDDALSQAEVIFINDTPQDHSFHEETDEDWVKFHAMPGTTYTIKASDLTIVCDAAIALFNAGGTQLTAPTIPGGLGQDEYFEWTCPGGGEGIYYVRVTNENTNYGENTRYKLSVYIPIAGVPGTIWGFVFDQIGQGIGGALISFTLSGATGTTLSMNSGYYRAVLPSGTWPVGVEAPGYNFPSGQTVTVLAENEVLEFLYVTPPVKKGDINGDDHVNQEDANLALKVLSGGNPAGIRSDYVSSGADVNGNNKIGTEELVYILEKINGVRP